MPLVYTPEEVAEILRVSRASVYKMIKAGELPFVRVAGRIRVPHSHLERFLDAAVDSVG